MGETSTTTPNTGVIDPPVAAEYIADHPNAIVNPAEAEHVAYATKEREARIAAAQADIGRYTLKLESPDIERGELDGSREALEHFISNRERIIAQERPRADHAGKLASELYKVKTESGGANVNQVTDLAEAVEIGDASKETETAITENARSGQSLLEGLDRMSPRQYEDNVEDVERMVKNRLDRARVMRAEVESAANSASEAYKAQVSAHQEASDHDEATITPLDQQSAEPRRSVVSKIKSALRL